MNHENTIEDQMLQFASQTIVQCEAFEEFYSKVKDYYSKADAKGMWADWCELQASKHRG